MTKPLLCLDFDGVIHSYSSGWQGASIIPDPPVPGAIEFILAALEHFRVAIFSSRSETVEGIEAMKSWLVQAVEDWIQPKTIYDHRRAVEFVVQLEWPMTKPAAFLTIDDRAVMFTGRWPNPEHLLPFQPWTKVGEGGVFRWVDSVNDIGKPPRKRGEPLSRPERKPYAWAREGDAPFEPGADQVMHMRTGQRTDIWPAADRPAGDGWFPLYRDPA